MTPQSVCYHNNLNRLEDLLMINVKRQESFEKAMEDIDGEAIIHLPLFKRLAIQSRLFSEQLQKYIPSHPDFVSRPVFSRANVYHTLIDVKTVFYKRTPKSIFITCTMLESKALNLYQKQLDANIYQDEVLKAVISTHHSLIGKSHEQLLQTMQVS